jgi:hypothetical protein
LKENIPNDALYILDPDKDQYFEENIWKIWKKDPKLANYLLQILEEFDPKDTINERFSTELKENLLKIVMNTTS